MASITSFPAEILRECAQYLDHETLKAFRLVSRAASTVASERLFHTVELRLRERDFRRKAKDESAEHIKAIVERDSINQFVRKIVINGEDGAYFYEVDEDDDRQFVDKPWTEALKMVHRFPLLKEVELWFNNGCGLDPHCVQDLDQTKEYRDYYQDLVFKELGDSKLVKSLTIKNVQDACISATGPEDTSVAVRERLEILSILVATEILDEYSSAFESQLSIDAEAFHECFNQKLRPHWLIPTREHLTELTLYCDSYWGFWPFTDLRGIHFPNLKSLSLGSWSIAHDWQIEWVTSHGATLHSLILDDCPLIYVFRASLEIVNANWPDLKPKTGWGDIKGNILQQNDTRWSDIFAKFKAKLVNLQRFGLSHDPWEDTKSGSWGDYRNLREHMFETRHKVPARIETSRYIAFNHGPGDTQVAFNRYPHEPWVKHFPRRNSNYEDRYDSLLKDSDKKLEKEVRQEGNRTFVLMKNEHGMMEEINEPDEEDDAKDERALQDFLEAIGKTDNEIQKMKLLQWKSESKDWVVTTSEME